MNKKTIEPTGDVCIRFSEEELEALGLKAGDKLNFRETADGFLLEKFVNLELDMSDWSRDTLEFLIQESCKKDLSVNEVISNILECTINNENLP